MTVVYIYLIATMECIGQPDTTGVDKFKGNPNLFFPDWNQWVRIPRYFE